MGKKILPKTECKFQLSPSTKMPGGICIYANLDLLDYRELQWVNSQKLKYKDRTKNIVELPVTCIKSMLNTFMSIDINIKLSSKQFEQKHIETPDTVSTKLFDYQSEGVDYACSKEKFLLGDDLGLGKTLQTITTAAYLKEKYNVEHCLVVCCTNILKYNWLEEIQKHSSLSCRLLGQHITKKGKITTLGIKERVEDLESKIEEFFVITNVETLRDARIQNAIKKGPNNFGIIAIDEIHKANNPSSKQGKALIDLFSDTKFLIGISGTIAPNRPENCFLPLTLVGEEKCTWTDFQNFYIETSNFNKGYKNLDILREQLNFCMLRRKKTEVLDLPDKIWKTEYVELYPEQKGLYDEVITGIKANIDKVKISAVSILAQFIRLRQVTGCPHILTTKHTRNAKLDRLEELVEQIIYSGHKCVIASNWTSVTDEVLKRLNKWGTVEITGNCTDSQRNEAKLRFQSDSNIKVCVGTIGAMGVGITLTAADYVIFIDEPWTQADKTQVEDRCHRIGTKSNVTIITLICKDTLDEVVNNIVFKKGLLLDYLNGDIDVNDTHRMADVLNYVLQV